MWDYSDRRDLTRISLDELREAKIDECVHAITNIKKKSPVPKVFGAVAFIKAFPRIEVRPLSNSSLVPQLCRLVLKTIEILAQVIEVARCYLPQPKVGDYPGRDFTEVPEGSTSAAPSPPRAPKKQLIADVVEDSEDLDDTHLSSGDDDDSAIPVSPLSSRPPLRAGKRALPKFGVDAS
jgi:hypothetical protein